MEKEIEMISVSLCPSPIDVISLSVRTAGPAMHRAHRPRPALMSGDDNSDRIASVGREAANDLRGFLSGRYVWRKPHQRNNAASRTTTPHPIRYLQAIASHQDKQTQKISKSSSSLSLPETILRDDCVCSCCWVLTFPVSVSVSVSGCRRQRLTTG